MSSSTRFGKSTHISMISNSVTHLRSYTNSAIADIAENSTRSQTSPHRALISLHWMTSVWVFHDASQCFKSVSWCFTSGSWCFTSGSWCFTSGSWCITMFYMCFMMFYYVLCLASRAMIVVKASATANHLRDATTPLGSAMMPQGSWISPRMWSQAKLHPEWRLE